MRIAKKLTLSFIMAVIISNIAGIVGLALLNTLDHADPAYAQADFITVR